MVTWSVGMVSAELVMSCYWIFACDSAVELHHSGIELVN